MKIHIIQPTHFAEPHSRKLFKVKKLNLMPLTLAYLAALMPVGSEVTLTDERTQELDLKRPFDLVLITVWTLNSLRAYEIAREYRKKGIPVVLGGPHCYFYSDEAAGEADAVAVGEGEVVLPEIIADLEKKDLKKFYRAGAFHDLKGLPLPRRDLLDPSTFTRFHTVAVQTSRGCPFSCEFCAERFYLGMKYRMRPVKEVIEEIRSTGCRRIFFADSTFSGNRARTMELMEELVDLKIRWSALWTANRVLDREFMILARKSGLLHVNLGIESIKQETLDGMNKKTSKAATLEEVIKALRELDISFSFNLIFGWDTDRPEDFIATLKFLQRNRVHVAFFNSFCPYKGTPIYERYLSQGRILDPESLNRWPGITARVRPRNFSPEDLAAGIRMMYREFYSWPSILKRLPPPTSAASITSWVMNLSQRKMAATNATNFDNY
ncbi:MAG: B12-binding domain-containing radical SAM protein [Thermodesulfobacteriota bacterium]